MTEPLVKTRLDHVFVACRPSEGEPVESSSKACADRVAAALCTAGFVEGPGRDHPGQGTANRCFFFEHFMFELLYVDDAASLGSADTSRFGLRDRFLISATSPFGIAFAPAVHGSSAPFEVDVVRPPYLPDGLSIEVARVSTTTEPLLFHLPFAGPGVDKQRQDDIASHPNGVRSLAQLTYSHGGGSDTEVAELLKSLGVGVSLASEQQLALIFLTESINDPVEVTLMPDVPVRLSLLPMHNSGAGCHNIC